MSTLERPVRADAERNRRRILVAAGELFAQRGLDVSMDDVARAAGVGVGTVYRRFGDRDALIDALFEAKLAAVAAVAREGMEREDAWDGLRHFLVSTARMHAQDRGLKEALLSTSRGRERVARARETIAPLAQRLVARARDAGVLREDFAALDIPMLQHAVATVSERTRDVAPEYYERILTLLLDGMLARRDGVTPMTAPPLRPAEWARCARA